MKKTSILIGSIQAPKLITKLSIAVGIAMVSAFTCQSNAASATGSASQTDLTYGGTSAPTSLNSVYAASTTSALGTVYGASTDFATFSTTNVAQPNNATLVFNHEASGTTINNDMKVSGTGSLVAYGASPDVLSWTGGSPTATNPAYQGFANNNNGNTGVAVGSGLQFTISLGATQNSALLNVYTTAYSPAAGGPLGQLVLTDSSGILYDSGATSLPATNATHSAGYFAVNLSGVAGDTITVQYLNNGVQGGYNNLGIQAASIAAVPEPSTVVLAMIFGIGMLFFFRRRRIA